MGVRETIAPETIFYYIYAILYSNSYRQKYAEFLKTDFPRVPFTSNKKVFAALAKKGEELVNLHLLKSNALDKPVASFEGDDSNKVEKLSYEIKTGRLWINPKQYFKNIKPEIWNYHIGGYRVAEKWLKDRKNRRLTSDEVSQYCRIVTALANTIKIQESLDTLFEQAEAELQILEQ
jgi:predicted helicase